MSANPATAQQETQAAQAPAEPTEAIAGTAREAAPKPEQAVAPEAIAANDSSIAPTGRPPLQKPEGTADVAAVAPATPAANDSLKETATAIEQQLAKYIGERLSAEQANGLTIDVVLAKSNAVTGAGSSRLQELHDIALTIKGPFVSEEQKNVSWEGNALAALKQHPAFLALSNDASERVYHHFSLKKGDNTGDDLVLKTYSLDKAALEELLKPHPVQQGTPITGTATTPEAHACVGANCSHCATPSKAEALATPATEAKAPAASTTPATAATVTEQPAITEAKPEGLATAPATQVAAPANHQGVAANKEHLAIGA